MATAGLPPEATALVRRIEALLDEAAPLLSGAHDSGEAGFALRETRARYLPDTLRAYTAVPPSLRAEADPSGNVPDAALIEQLTILERATAQRLRALAADASAGMGANRGFLAERFGSLTTLPEAPPRDDLAPAERGAPPTLVREFFAGLGAADRADGRALVAATAERFTSVFPALVSVRRGGLFGSGAPESVAIEVPRGDASLRYAVALGRGGALELTCTRVVRGVALRTERVPFDEWFQALYEDLEAYVAHDHTTRVALARFLER